jgi:acetylglutamate kinase
MTDLSNLAAPLLRATARARSLKDATLVIKLGGSAMEDPAATKGTLDAVAVLYDLGLQLIIVHGGGKPIDRAMADAGIEPRKIHGRRVTDEATLEIVVKVLSEISESLAAQLETRGVSALALTDQDLMPVSASLLAVKGESLGYVGQPDSVDGERITAQLVNGTIPVIPSIALASKQDVAGHDWLNVNADTMASAIAGELNSETIYFLTDTPGVLANRNDPASLYVRLTVAECRKLIADGVIEGGMIPKVEACFEALDAGAKRAVILDGRNPYSLLSEFVSDTALGTEILP